MIMPLMMSRMNFLDSSQHPYDGKEIITIIAQAKENSLRVKYTGGKYPANSCNAEVSISLNSFKRLLSYDPLKNTITVEPGITLKELVTRMEYLNYTLDIYGTIPDMTIADAINVGLIGSNGSISHCLKSCSVALPDSSVLEWTWPAIDQIPDPKKHIRKGENFVPSLQTLVCGLGAVGIITKSTLTCVPNKYAQENIYDTSMEDFIENMKKLSEALYVNANWFPLFDKVIVTNASLVRLRLAEFQPWWKQCVEYFFWGVHRILKSMSPSICWHFTGHAAFLSYSQFTFMKLANMFRSTYSYKPQTFISVRSYCSGIKWVFPMEKLLIITKMIETWSKGLPRLCSTPLLISLQTHHGFNIHRPFLCPYSERKTFSIWTDWFNSASINTEFSAPMAEFESILQKNGGRKCWSAGPVYASPLIGNMYPGYRHWCETRTLIDPKTMFRSAYIEGDVIGD